MATLYSPCLFHNLFLSLYSPCLSQALTWSFSLYSPCLFRNLFLFLYSPCLSKALPLTIFALSLSRSFPFTILALSLSQSLPFTIFTLSLSSSPFHYIRLVSLKLSLPISNFLFLFFSPFLSMSCRYCIHLEMRQKLLLIRLFWLAWGLGECVYSFLFVFPTSK